MCTIQQVGKVERLLEKYVYNLDEMWDALQVKYGQQQHDENKHHSGLHNGQQNGVRDPERNGPAQQVVSTDDHDHEMCDTVKQKQQDEQAKVAQIEIEEDGGQGQGQGQTQEQEGPEELDECGQLQTSCGANFCRVM